MSSTSNPKVTIIDPDDGYPVNVTEDGLKVDVGSNIDIGTVTIGDVTVANPFDGAVTGTFWQATQPVSGTFWQSTQPVSGAFYQATQPVSIASMPTTAVTGTFWQATQPVSGTFWQATQPVSGTFWQATQPVSGDVGHNITGMTHAIEVVGTDHAQLPSQACKRVDFMGNPSNAGNIYIGSSSGIGGTGGTGGIRIQAGDFYSIDIDDLDKIFIEASEASQILNYIYYT